VKALHLCVRASLPGSCSAIYCWDVCWHAHCSCHRGCDTRNVDASRGDINAFASRQEASMYVVHQLRLRYSNQAGMYVVQLRLL